MIVVIAEITVVAGKREEFLEEFHKLMPEVHAEQGCIEYGPQVEISTPIEAQQPPREQVVTIFERWSDVPALQAHLQAPHMNAWRERAGHLIEGVSLRILEPTAPGSPQG